MYAENIQDIGNEGDVSLSGVVNIAPKEDKTIREYFEEFHEPYKTDALKKLSEQSANRRVKDKEEALLLGFYWGTGEEGLKWHKLFDSLNMDDDVKPETK